MTTRIQKPIPKVKKEEAEELAAEDAAAQETAREAADLEATDELLDEIDALLEENAEEFLRNYIQKGGQ